MANVNKDITVLYKNLELHIAVKYREGAGDLILYIHGLGCDKENFDAAWKFKRMKDLSILAIDLPGFGHSPGVENFSYDMSDHAEICRSVLMQFPNTKYHIVGHSMGGAVGVLLSEMIHDRLASFTSVEGNLVGQDCTVSRHKATVPFAEFERNHLPGLILVTSISHEPGRRVWSDSIRKADKKGFYLSSRSLVNWSDSGMLLNKFRDMNCKKVYIYGESNSFMNVLPLLGGIPSVCISNSGHFPMIDNPGEFFNSLADFLGC